LIPCNTIRTSCHHHANLVQEIVLSQDQDPFFKKNMYLNFGELGQNAKEYVEQFASKSQGNAKLDSITDMKRFIEDYPEFRKLSGNVTKHVTLVGELSRRVGEDHLLDVSELEQSLACNDNHTNDLKTIQRLIQDPAVPAENKLRLTAIYALRYAKHSSLQSDAPGATGIPELFQPSNLFGGARDRFKGLKGVENVYTQHSPRLEMTLQDLIRGNLRDQAYPFIDNTGPSTGPVGTRDKPQDIIVFMVGGATYEEARTVAQVNASSPGVRVVLGGTSILNSSTFLGDVEEGVDAWPEERGADASARLRREVGR
jgi:vacuolar protein sorting-associated protein 45